MTTKLAPTTPTTRTTTTPTVSILIAVHNGAATLDRCLQSIANQTFTDYELICVDDASTDDTPAILQKWQDQFRTAQGITCRIITNPHNLGLTRSLNHGLAQAQGTYLARLDADDWWEETKLAQQVTFLNDHPSYGIIGTQYRNHHAASQHLARTSQLPITNDHLKATIYRHNPFGHSTVLIRTALIQQTGGYDDTVYYGQDRDLWFRLAPHTKFHNLSDVLCHRQVDGSLSVTKSRQQMWQGIKTRLKYIKRDHAAPTNYLYLLEPLAIILAPRWLKSLYHHARSTMQGSQPQKLSHHSKIPSAAQTSTYQLTCFNDRPLTPTRAETTARQAMAAAFQHHPHISSVTVTTRKPWQFLFNPKPTTNNRQLATNNSQLSTDNRQLLYARTGALASAALALWRPTTTKLIIEVHNTTLGQRPLADALYRFAFRRADLLLTIAPSTKRNWIAAGVPATKIHVLPSGVDRARFDAIKDDQATLRRQLNLPLDEKILIYTGNLYRDRDIETILAATSTLATEPKPTHTLFIGGTDQDRQYYQAYQQRHYPQLGNITWHPHQPPTRVAQYLKAADLILVTYSPTVPTASTMSPLKLFEAMASQTPFITADLPRLRDIVSEAHATFYEPSNADSLHHAITTTLDDPAAASRAATAHDHVSHFTWSERIATIMDILDHPT